MNFVSSIAHSSFRLNFQYPKLLIVFLLTLSNKMGAKVDWDFRISDLVKNPDGTVV